MILNRHTVKTNSLKSCDAILDGLIRISLRLAEISDAPR